MQDEEYREFMLAIGTDIIPSEDGAFGGLRTADHDHGVIVFVNGAVDAAWIEENEPEWIRPIMQYARATRCALVNFDADATPWKPLNVMRTWDISQPTPRLVALTDIPTALVHTRVPLDRFNDNVVTVSEPFLAVMRDWFTGNNMLPLTFDTNKVFVNVQGSGMFQLVEHQRMRLFNKLT